VVAATEEIMTTAIVCTALLAVLVFGLGLAVSMTRGSTGTVIGHVVEPTDRLHKLVRAHANACEYAPMLAVLILLLGARDPAAWVTWTSVAATFARYLHAAGMIFFPTLAKPNPLRFAGALGTYVTGLALTVAALLSV
jgi:uncharacterized membrane protein YecN with MAPEG domain